MKNRSVKKLTMKQFAAALTARPRDAHKGLYGHVLVVGGDAGYSGAVRMAAEAALRVGAGLVSVATRASHAFAINIGRPEIMCHGVENEKTLKPLLDKATVIIIGPGLGQSAWGSQLLNSVLKSKKPLIVDADGLNLLSKKPMRYADWVLTPHPAEAGRLLSISADQIQRDRLSAVKKLQAKFGGVCVLKGSGSLVMGQGEPPAICEAGNPGMASAGMGDVLSGVIGGLAAQHLSLLTAAKLGVLVHATAGDQVAKQQGERGMIATDLLPFLHQLVNFK